MARRDESRDQKKRKRPNPEYKSRNALVKPEYKSRNALEKPESNAKMPKRNLPSSLVVQDEEPEFPRGGRSILSREEENEARAEAEEEFDREQGLARRGRDKYKKNKKKGTGKSFQAGEEDKWGSLFGQGITGKIPRLTNRITWKNISPGMKLWGVITEVNLKDLVISLPGGLRGFVHARDASDLVADNQDKVPSLLPNTLNVGQLVSCVVLQVGDDKREENGRKRIKLSLRLSVLYKGLTLDAIQDGMVLIGQVKSVEDHGYILQFGVPSFTGFLPKMVKGDMQICRGQMLQCVVKSVDKVRAVVYTNSSTDLVSKYVTKDLKGLSIDLLVPGMMVNGLVHSKLENGIILSFLTYFTGTVDVFHLQNPLPTANWKDDYTQHKKVNARILFIDPSTRAVGLTLNPHLLEHKPPPMYVNTGEIYDKSRILRIDENFGLLLSIPSSPEHTAAYVHLSEVADEEVLKLKKKFKEGGYARLRVQGVRRLEGLALGTLKASAFERPIFTHSDVKPGMLVRAKVIAVEPYGAIILFGSGVKALCPCRHMSEFERIKPAKKFKVGAELLFRVLGCKSKRITVTHKRTLVKSKLAILSSHAEATEGLITHGWISKIENHGCYVKFYNGVQGFAPRSELDLEPGSEPNAVYHVEQVVKCRITSSGKKINVSFVISPKSNDADVVALGSIVSGVVDKLTPTAVIINIKSSSHFKGLIAHEHLADHQDQVALLKSLLRIGYVFDKLVVLDITGSSLVLSAKYSLVHFVKEIPLDISHMHPLAVVRGYICNIIGSGCFVRFLGRLTGFSLKIRATDHKVDSLFDSFYVGQSVRSHVVDVSNDTGKIKLAMKQSLCFSTDASYIQGYFHVEDKISTLQSLNGKNSDSKWVKDLTLGSVLTGEVQEIKEFGVVLGFKNYGDIVGFVSQHQLGGITVEKGSVVRAFVLDISKSESLVDLSLKPELVNRNTADQSDNLSHISKKKRQRTSSLDLELHQTVNAAIEIVKENYLVLSLPEHDYAVGYASIIDYNTEKLPHKHFLYGQRVSATVEALPTSDSGGRLLLLLKSLSEVSDSSHSKRAKKLSNYTVGSLVEAEIVEIKSLELIVKFGPGIFGKIHKTEVEDEGHLFENPFSKFHIGQLVNARIIANVSDAGKNNHTFKWLLSVKPSILTGSAEALTSSIKIDEVSVGSIVKGYVVKVDTEWVKVSLSRTIMAHLFILDTSSEPDELTEFHKRFSVGQAVTGLVISINKEKKVVRLSSRLPSSISKKSFEHKAADNDNKDKAFVASKNIDMEHIMNGDVIGGRIKKILPNIGGILVQIGPHLFGKVHYTEIADSWIADPSSGYQESQFVRCKVLEISRSSSGFMHADLSLRSSLTSAPELVKDKDPSSQRFEKIEELCPNMEVHGYVKNVTSRGCFIMLSRKLDARILVANLSDGFVENPDKEFPVGKAVHGRVLSVELSSKRVDVTLKENVDSQLPKPDACSFSSVHVGSVVSGHIRRVESFGLFIAIDGTNLVGLCHISELSDDDIDHIETKYRASERVVAKILKIDEERKRIALGMKKSHFEDAKNAEITGDSLAINCSSPASKQDDDGGVSVLSQVESRASVLPLQVSLDYLDTHMEGVISANQDDANEVMEIDRKKDRHLKRKEKQERELEISAYEERCLQNDMPQTVDDFEKLVRSSPNSSFFWIKYVEFVLGQAGVEKARSIAERALKTIIIKEEGERLNIWVAYFNLENAYGSSPEEDVEKIFKRALQTCDPKKLHLALLGVYERTEQHKLADVLLDKMTKKFKKSCKVWLRRLQHFLKQKEDSAQYVINRALLSLPAKKHIKFISHSAILAFKCGVPEMGRSMFEGMLREHPKRTDLWSIYLDQEIRLGDQEMIRALFERATCLSLPAKKMKFLFKKYHAYEESQGDQDRVENVKKKALQFLETSS